MNMFLPYSNEVTEIPCTSCGGSVIEFTIPNDIWNKVMRKNKETNEEYICINCWYNNLRKILNINE